MTEALKRCYELAEKLHADGWNREVYQAMMDLAYEEGIFIAEDLEAGEIMVEDEMFTFEVWA